MKEILEQYVKKGIVKKEGHYYWLMNQKYVLNITNINNKTSYQLTRASFGSNISISDLLFNHDLARAFWDEEDKWYSTECTCGGLDFHVFGQAELSG